MGKVEDRIRTLSTHLHIDSPSTAKKLSLSSEIDLLFTEGLLADALSALSPSSAYTEATPLIIHNTVPDGYFSVASIPGTPTTEHCPQGCDHPCVRLKGAAVPTIVVSTTRAIAADVVVYIFCDARRGIRDSAPLHRISGANHHGKPASQRTQGSKFRSFFSSSDPPKEHPQPHASHRPLRQVRPFGREGPTLAAEFLSEPSRRSLACRTPGTRAPADFLLSFQPGADIFLPPWQLHVPVPWDVFFFEEHKEKRPFELLGWEEKARLARKGSVEGFEGSTGQHRLALYVANNCEEITRTHWVRGMMRFSENLVDSIGTCLGNCQVPLSVRAWRWDDALGKTYGWASLYEKYVQKLIMSSEYFFHLAFENEVQDPLWITEKFIGAFVSGSVPVLLGPSEWSRKFLPAPHSAVFYDDFQNAEALAAFLTALAADQKRYEAYLSWRSLPLEQLNPNFVAMFDTTRRYRFMHTLSSLVAYSDEHPEVAQHHRVHVPRMGFVDEEMLASMNITVVPSPPAQRDFRDDDDGFGEGERRNGSSSIAVHGWMMFCFYLIVVIF